MAQTKRFTGGSECVGFIATAVVCHHPFDPDLQLAIPGNSLVQEGHRVFLAFRGQHLAEPEPRMIVYTDVHELPADAAGVALAGAVAGDAMTRAGELAQLLDVDVD